MLWIESCIENGCQVDYKNFEESYKIELKDKPIIEFDKKVKINLNNKN